MTLHEALALPQVTPRAFSVYAAVRGGLDDLGLLAARLDLSVVDVLEDLRLLHGLELDPYARRPEVFVHGAPAGLEQLDLLHFSSLGRGLADAEEFLDDLRRGDAVGAVLVAEWLHERQLMQFALALAQATERRSIGCVSFTELLEADVAVLNGRADSEQYELVRLWRGTTSPACEVLVVGSVGTRSRVLSELHAERLGHLLQRRVDQGRLTFLCVDDNWPDSLLDHLPNHADRLLRRFHLLLC